MLVFAKLNNHVDNHKTLNANHSVSELLFNTFVSFKMVLLMVLTLNKPNKIHAKVLMDQDH
jgi:hypothetical protein